MTEPIKPLIVVTLPKIISFLLLTAGFSLLALWLSQFWVN